MTPNLMPLNQLGAVQTGANTVRFGLCLPWVSAANGNQVLVKIIHERDQFIQGIAPQVFALNQGNLAPYGEYWSAVVPIAAAAAAPGSAWGTPGRYVYRYQIDTLNVGSIDWVSDPFAREFSVGKLSAFTLNYQPYVWSLQEANWQTPRLSDLVLYEINIQEFGGGGILRATEMLAYLRDLGVNAIEVMPLSNVGVSIDWGYLPIGYFGVDERLGNRADFQRLVDLAHQHGIAIIIDVVYGHTGMDFPYYDAYARLQYQNNPFIGTFAADLFSDFAMSTDFNKQLTRDYFYTASHHWLEVYHVDGFRYDCVPNYWDGYQGIGYANQVYETHLLVRQQIAAGTPYWSRFAPAAPNGPLRLIQCAEQLERPIEVLESTYSNCTWQNVTYDTARDVARGDRGRLADLGLWLTASQLIQPGPVNGETIPKLLLQYIENHDHERFVCNFGRINRDRTGNWLYEEGDRSRWYMVQPYLIALLMSQGIPMLWQGQELGENYFLPTDGAGRVGMLRPVRWDYFYDPIGKQLIWLVRRLLAIRRNRAEVRQGNSFFFNNWNRYQSQGMLLFARYVGAQYTLVAVNTDGVSHTVPFWFPVGGNYIEQIYGGAPVNYGAWVESWITVPAHDGRIWSI
jgi:maltooligosyltrehalose trehalohydrolase